MDTAKTIIELRESTGMSRKEFSEHTDIPVRTLEDWEAGRRTPPKYIPRLLAYQMKFEGMFSSNVEVKGKRNVSVIQDVDGNNIVIINYIRSKGKRSIDWKDVREYLREYVGELERYNVFHASMLVRHSNDGKMYLYDVIDIKKETSYSLGE